MGLGPLLLEWFSTQFIAERKYVCADGERNHFGMRSPPRLMTSISTTFRFFHAGIRGVTEESQDSAEEQKVL